jgi:hypothetical protein
LPWALAPPDGRYVVRGHAGEPTHVLVVGSLAAQRAGRRPRRRRAREVEPEPSPPAVPVTRVTLVAAEPFGDRAEAERWLRGADGEAEVHEALAVLERVLHALRVASADPSIGTPSRAQALVVRLGLGEGEQVAEGRWARALELPGGAPPTRRRAGRGGAAGGGRAGDRMAALLGGRDAALACEELALRARADVDADRHREAALQLRAALEAALAELQPWSDRGDLADRLAELAAAREAVDDAATATLAGGLDDAQITGVAHVLGRLEAALRARTAAGSD